MSGRRGIGVHCRRNSPIVLLVNGDDVLQCVIQQNSYCQLDLCGVECIYRPTVYEIPSRSSCESER